MNEYEFKKMLEKYAESINYGEQIEELYKKSQKLAKIDYSHIEKYLSFKNEADLRILDILGLKQKFSKLINTTTNTLKQHQLYKNIDEPLKIII